MPQYNPFPPGTRVKCAYRNQHMGTVLAKDDPRAWAGSLAFPEASPDPQAVRAHVARCESRGDLSDATQPVAWDFGRIYWDRQLYAAEDD